MIGQKVRAFHLSPNQNQRRTEEQDIDLEKEITLAGTIGGINTEEDLSLLNDYENELMDLLTSYVPRLLKHSSFFRNAFYG